MLELLVAMAVLSILVVLMFGMVDGATRLWRENENRVEAYREARAALTVMARDLRNALAGTNTAYFDLNNPSRLPASSPSTNTGGSVFFLAALPSRAQDPTRNKSDVCEVGYFLAFARTPASTNETLNLYRYFRSSDPTFTNRSGAGLFTNAVVGQTGEELLARNVTSLKLTAFSTNAAGEPIPYAATTNAPLPALVEISVTTINNDASKKLSTLGDWTNTAHPVVARAAQTFTTRVRLLNKP